LYLCIDGESVAPGLAEALEKIDSSGGELVLDFSSVRRIDSCALRVLEKLAGTADAKTVKVMLRGANVEIYKALKLAKLAPSISFAA
jgi:anti-anti-sigma regulatory factor